jgi:uncharacterized protein YkwD
MKFGILLLVFPFLLSKEERTFKRLNKQYEKNTEKAFLLAKKISSKDKNLASPYYFQFLVYGKKADLTKASKDQATNLGNAISAGSSFEKKAGESLLTQTDWTTKKEGLKVKVIACLTKLRAEKNDSRFKKLKDKATNFFSEMPIDLVEQKQVESTKNKSTDKEMAKTTFAAPKHLFPSIKTESSKINFTVKPTGKEQFLSFNESEEQKLIDQLNAARIEKNLQPLAIDPDLVRAARYHARDMGKENYFEHATNNKLNGKLTKSIGAFERIALFYPQGGNTENIAAGNSTAEETYNQWFNSPGHFENMFNEAATKVGIGVYHDSNSDFGYYWVFCTAIN